MTERNEAIRWRYQHSRDNNYMTHFQLTPEDFVEMGSLLAPKHRTDFEKIADFGNRDASYFVSIFDRSVSFGHDGASIAFIADTTIIDKLANEMLAKGYAFSNLMSGS